VPESSLKIPEISGQLPDKVLLAASRVDRPDLGGRRQRQIVYRVRAGETFEQHCAPPRHAGEHSRAPEQHGAGDTLVKGQRLVIKASARRYRDEGVSPRPPRALHRAQRDTVYSISKQFQVSVPAVKTWNGLNRHHQIEAGTAPVMYVDSNRQRVNNYGFFDGKRRADRRPRTDRSIAWGIRAAMHSQGRRNSRFAYRGRHDGPRGTAGQAIGSDITFVMDVGSDEEISEGIRAS